MKLRNLLLGTACALGSIGAAQAATGWYFSMGAGANWLRDADFELRTTTTIQSSGQLEFDTGFAVMSSVGYDWGRWRAEFEVAYRQNAVDCATFSGAGGSCIGLTNNVDGDIWELSQMVNVLYDIPLGGRFSASIGAGVGGVLVVAEPGVVGYSTAGAPDLDDYVFAGQLIAGMSYDLTDRVQLFADYRYLHADDPDDMRFVDVTNGDLLWATFEKSDHTALIGLRFDLQRDVAEAAPVPPPVVPKAPKQFMVFFGFDKSNLTADAMRVINEAAAAAKDYGSASILITGHTDSSGSAKYNQALSMRRAAAVKAGLAGYGIQESMISTSGRGEDELMVQTGDGVKEPQNRRATIDLN